MILANVAAAETLEKARVPLIYRVHDEPSLEKLDALREFLATIDMTFAKGGVLRAANFNRILARVKGRDAEQLVNEVVLRTPGAGRICRGELRPFRPQPAPLRAFHLADPPLRRPDRASRADPRAQARRRRPARGTPSHRQLAEIAAEISATERRAMAAERETIDRLIAHFLADRVGATFDGRISGVTRAGLFVKLQRDRRRRLRAGAHPRRRIFPLRGGRAAPWSARAPARPTGSAIRVTVKLVEAAPVAGALRFELSLRPSRHRAAADASSRRGREERGKHSNYRGKNGRHDERRTRTADEPSG